jgi:hypothetical protein
MCKRSEDRVRHLTASVLLTIIEAWLSWALVEAEEYGGRHDIKGYLPRYLSMAIFTGGITGKASAVINLSR